MEDPRITLKFVFRLSLILIVFVPIVYFTLKFNPIRLLIDAVIIIIVIFLIRKFYKKSKEEALASITPVGYMFAFTYGLIALLMLVFGAMVYFKNSEVPPPLALLIFFLLLIFSVILFWYSNKSKRYEKKLLGKSKSK